MKVSTDACIQGAWAAQQCQSVFPQDRPGSVLDIGTGTGLLSLMLAQFRPGAIFDAVEIDTGAGRQAEANFANSPWPGQFSVHLMSLGEFISSGRSRGGYDLLICNPPFFHNQLQAPMPDRNRARHSVSLDKDSLAAAATTLAGPEGLFCVMYPSSEWPAWLEAAGRNGWQEQRVLEVFPHTGKAANRMIGLFGKNISGKAVREQLMIYNPDRTYTPAFRKLLQPYYLAL